MTTAAVDPAIGVGKNLNDQLPTHGHVAPNADAQDTRSIEDVTKRDPLPVDPVSLLEGDLSKLESLDPKALEAALGVGYGDKSTDGGVTGADAPAHVLAERAAQAAAAEPEAPVVQPTAPAATATPPAGATEPPAGGSTETGEVIATRDGKGTIPYAVLAAERRRVAELERALAEAKAAPTAAPQPGAAAAGDEQDGADGAEQSEGQEDLGQLLEQVRAEFPETLAKAVELAVTRATNAERQLAAMNEQRAQTYAERVTDIIDADPVLSAWRDAEDKSTFDLAIEVDDELRVDPRWHGRPLEERFEAAKQITAIRAGITLPPAGAKPPVPSVPAPAGGAVSGKPSLEAAAAAVLAAAQQKAVGRPLSHSDLPAGTAPPQSEQEGVAGLSSLQVSKLFDNAKDFNQIDAILARIA